MPAGSRSLRVATATAILAAGCASQSGHRPGPAHGTTYATAYAISYRDLVNRRSHWEVLTVQRPFNGSDLTYAGAAPPGADARATGGFISTPTSLFEVSASGTRQVSGRQPGPPSGDEYVGSELGALVGRGLAIDRDAQRTIAGRPCSLYRFAAPPSGPIAPVTSKATDHDDLCIDAAGLVLGETWTYHANVVERRTAVVVAVGPEAVRRSDLPRAPSSATAKSAPAAAPSVTPTDVPVTPLAPPAVPAGFRVALRPQLFRLPNPDSPATLAARSVVWSFDDAAHRVITVEAGSESGDALPWAAHDTLTQPVALPSLGTATTALRSDGAEIRVVLRSGGWVRVHGTVPLPALISYARQLRLR